MENQVISSGTVSFSYDIVNLTKIALQVFIDKHNKNEYDESKRMASNEVIYWLISDDEVMDLLNRWSELNNGETTLFKIGIDHDATQIWEMIWSSEKWKESFDKHIIRGHSGLGVYDTVTKKFTRCLFGEHFEAIKEILEDDHPELNFKESDLHNPNYDSKPVDDFIMYKLILIGNMNNTESYTPSERFGHFKKKKLERI